MVFMFTWICTTESIHLTSYSSFNVSVQMKGRLCILTFRLKPTCECCWLIFYGILPAFPLFYLWKEYWIHITIIRNVKKLMDIKQICRKGENKTWQWYKTVGVNKWRKFQISKNGYEKVKVLHNLSISASNFVSSDQRGKWDQLIYAEQVIKLRDW